MTYRISAVLLTIAVACAHSAAPRPTAGEAMRAYEAHDWSACSARWAAVATSGTYDAGRALYNAACCDALAGHADLAFTRLDAATAAGYDNVDRIKADGDLATLRGDQRWEPALATAAARHASWERSLQHPELRRELLEMAAADQAARNALLATDQARGSAAWLALAKAVEDADARDTERLHEIVVAYGWPGKHMVGDDGATAAWLLAQHADRAPALQKEFLARMKAAVDRGEASGADYAYLYDRVAVAEHRMQLYGTQFDDTEPFPIEDAAHVDERRAALGLPSMAEYRKKLLELYGKPR